VPRGKWSLKEDRRLIELGRSGLSLKKVAERMDRTPEAIDKTARRLGLTFRPKRQKPATNPENKKSRQRRPTPI
jgi:hypothetical protein